MSAINPASTSSRSNSAGPNGRALPANLVVVRRGDRRVAILYWYQLADMAQVLAWTLLFTLVMLAIELGILKQLEHRLFGWRPRVGL